MRWPSIVGNEWTPLALLFAHRFCVTTRWRDAAALAAFVGTQMLESFYQVVPIAVLGATYATALLIRHRARFRVLWPKLLGIGVVIAAVLRVVAPPYLHARRVWGTLRSVHDTKSRTVLAAGVPRLPRRLCRPRQSGRA